MHIYCSEINFTGEVQVKAGLSYILQSVHVLALEVTGLSQKVTSTLTIIVREDTGITTHVFDNLAATTSCSAITTNSGDQV